jgi:hypothetical protein
LAAVVFSVVMVLDTGYSPGGTGTNTALTIKLGSGQTNDDDDDNDNPDGGGGATTIMMLFLLRTR